MLRVAVIGAGYWGPNLIRNFAASPTAKMVAVCDRDGSRLKAALQHYPAVEACQDVDALLARPDLDAVAIATPVHTHAPLAAAALRAGKHVLVEKPLAGSVADAEMLVHLAEKRGLVLMTDHTFIYSPAVQRLKALIDQGELGEIYYLDSVRINLGLFQSDVNVLWDLAPHDLSIIDFLLREQPAGVSAWGVSHTHSNIEDVAYLNLKFHGRLLASVHVNWLSPVKVRQFIIGGSKKSVVYNDLEPTEKIKVYDRGITLGHDLDARRGVLIGYRTGDVWSPHLEQTEPLRTMVDHFCQCICDGKRPLTDGRFGLRIVQVLETAEQSMHADGQRLPCWPLRRAG